MFDHEVLDPFIGFQVMSRDSPHFFLAKVHENPASKNRAIHHSNAEMTLEAAWIKWLFWKEKNAELLAVLQAYDPQTQTSEPHPTR